MAGIKLDVRDLGGYIREQRSTAQISLRQLSRLAGVSNPYLSQIERGLRKPSAEILQQIAKALRISAEALYVQAGILDERDPESDTEAAILADRGLTERQKQVLLEILESFQSENVVRNDQSAPATTLTHTVPEPVVVSQPPVAARARPSSRPTKASPPAKATKASKAVKTGTTAAHAGRRRGTS